MRRLLIGLTVGILLVAGLPTAVLATSFGTLGTFVSTTSTDFAPVVSTPGGVDFCIGYVKDPSALTDASKRAWFFQVGTDGDCTDDVTVAQRSFRITSYGGALSRTWLTSSDTTYLNKAFDRVLSIASASWLCVLESDGIPLWSPGDPVFIDTEAFDGGASGVLTVNDLRLVGTSTTFNAPFTVTAGIVKSTDGDLVLANKADDDPTVHPTSSTLGCLANAPSVVSVLDLGSKGTYDNLDDYYLSLSAPGVATQGIARLAGPSGSTSNQIVADTDSEIRDVLTYVATTASARVVTVNAGTTIAKNVYVHFVDGSGVDDHVQRNDLIVRRSATVAAGSAGTLVSTSTGAGELMEASAGDSLEALLYYLDLDGDANYDPATEGIYMQHPDNAAAGGDCTPGAGQVCIQVNDIRVTASAGKTAGSLVASADSDYTGNHATRKGETDLYLKLFSSKNDVRTPLTKVTNAKFVDTVNDNLWDPSSEDVYITSSSSTTTVSNGDIRVWTAGAEDSTTMTCPGSGQCGTAYEAGNIHTTGPDATWTAANDEQLVWSHDLFLTAGDYRLQTLGALDDGVILAADAGLGRGLLQTSGTTLYASVDAGCPGSCFPFPQVGDVQLYPSFGTVLTTSSSQVVPQTTAIATRLVRADYDVSNDLSKDAYYFDFGSTFAASQVLRMTTLDASLGSKPAGNFLTASDTTELSATKIVEADATTALGYKSGPLGSFNTDTTVYVDLPVALGAGSTGTITQWDSRITPYAQGVSFAAGTRVKNGDADASGTPAFTGTAFKFLWWDANRDATADSSDFFWLHQGASAPVAPGHLDVRLGGAAGIAAAPTGTPAGGTVVTTTTTTSSPSSSSTSTSSTNSTSTSASGTGSSSTTSSASPTGLAAANLAIAASLEVERKSGENVLTWDAQPGVDGYQVFSSNSPYVLVTTLQGQDRSSYTDTDGGKDTKYLVTAYTAGEELTADDVNNGDVPGYVGTPEGQEPSASHKGFIPAPSFAVVTLSLAALALALRRRL